MQIPKNLFKKRVDRVLQNYLKVLMDPEIVGKSVYPLGSNRAINIEVVKRASDVLSLMGVPHQRNGNAITVEKL